MNDTTNMVTLDSNEVEIDGGTATVKVSVTCERHDGDLYPASATVTIDLREGHLARKQSGWTFTPYPLGAIVETHECWDDTPGKAAREHVKDALDCIGLLDGYRVGARTKQGAIVLTLTSTGE